MQLRTPFHTSQLRPLPFLHCQLLPLYWCWCRVSRRAHTEHRGKRCPSAVKTDWPSKVVTTPWPQLQRGLLLLSITRAAETLSRRISCLIRAVGNLRLIDRLLRDYGPYLTFFGLRAATSPLPPELPQQIFCACMLQKHFPHNSTEILAAVDYRMPGIINILPLILRIKLASRYFTHFMKGGWGVGFLKWRNWP